MGLKDRVSIGESALKKNIGRVSLTDSYSNRNNFNFNYKIKPNEESKKMKKK